MRRAITVELPSSRCLLSLKHAIRLISTSRLRLRRIGRRAADFRCALLGRRGRARCSPPRQLAPERQRAVPEGREAAEALLRAGGIGEGEEEEDRGEDRVHLNGVGLGLGFGWA